MGSKRYDTFMEIAESLKKRQLKKWPEYFIPLSMMDDKHKKFYEDELVEIDDEAQQVEDVLGDINTGISIDDDLKSARLDKLKVETALAQQKLEEQKQGIWTEWNAEFFECFSDAFTKFKNELVSLHLNKEQLELLSEKLESALRLLQDQLDAMWSRYMKESKEEEKEAD